MNIWVLVGVKINVKMRKKYESMMIQYYSAT